jgi:DeoR/GlpR family transcriptional regulator of sugar metabolism
LIYSKMIIYNIFNLTLKSIFVNFDQKYSDSIKSMNFEKRKRKILEILQSDGNVSTSELNGILGTSEITIRRDLAKLESMGILQRTHGGAIRTFIENRMELSFLEKCKINLEEKTRIGQKAAEMVSIGDTIMMDAGTTTLQVAKHIKDKMGIHVVTNSIYVLLELAESPGIEVTLTGGDLRKISRSLIGPLAINAINNVHMDKLFLGATGISLDESLTSPNMIEAQTKNTMIKVAKTVILLADSSKFGKATLGKFGELNDIHILITDKKAPQKIIEAIIEKGIEVIQV